MSIITILLKKCYRVFFVHIPSRIYAYRTGIKYRQGYVIKGKACVIRQRFVTLKRLCGQNVSIGKLIIGKNFKCNNTFTSNSIGCYQRCMFNISTSNSIISIGDDVGISGTSINAMSLVSIGNNVLIGAGCLITDNDSHPLHYADRYTEKTEDIKRAPIYIEDNVFIGTRSIILKGVTIGKGAVIGAGSVVTKDIPPFCVAAGNPAKVIKELKHN